jgi:molybdate transport system ATP-binding protein
VAEWGIPTLFVSHDQADVRRLADRVVVLEAGRVIATGPTGLTLDRALLTQMRQRPALVNLLRVEDVQAVGDHWVGRLGGQPFHLPAANFQPGGRIHVQFLPQDVILAAEPIAGLSARNRLAGTVRELVALPDRTLVGIDVGQFLWAEVTAEAVQELAINPGQAIMCLIKTTAVALVQ